ncbi:MAG: efflux RND transporter periplasmic adaptor subunit [Polyangia bacterium]|jgi:membrane fusion protein (multidrug efflux system)
MANIRNNNKGWMVVVTWVEVAGAMAGCRKAAPPPRLVPEVAYQTVVPTRTVLSAELPGRITALLVAEIRPQVNGLIKKRAFQEGADVKAGSLLYQIDPTPYQAALDQAKASLAAAEADLPAIKSRAERLQSLVKIHAVGVQEAEEAGANHQKAIASVALAKAAYDSARINLAYTPIKAPISGRIGVSNVTVGAMVTAYQPTPLATIQQLDPIYVDVTQSSSELLRLRRSLESGRLKSGDGARTVKLVLEDGTPYPLAGKLQFRDVTVNPATGAVTLRMVFPNPEYVLLPGMFVRATVEEGTDEHAILVMQQGVSRDTKGNAVALVLDKSDKVELRMLSVDRAMGDTWLVTRGLAAGDRVIVEGMQKVRPGAQVKAVPFVAQVASPAERNVAAAMNK